MTSSQNNKGVGDSISTSLKPTENALRAAVIQSESVPVDEAPRKCLPVSSSATASAFKNASLQKGVMGSCRRNLWISYFFDGTGNNMEADLGLGKHSSVARLYRAHVEADPTAGIWPVYIPGLGTNFPAIGDEGKKLGLISGAGGDARLAFALQEFDRLLAKPLANGTAQTNAVVEINIAIFGFSRGAALARAFSNDLMRERCELREGKWKLKSGGSHVRFRFMGLFDTVASVGNTMSRNNMDYYNPAISDVKGMINERHRDYPRTRPIELAFSRSGAPGADPASGSHAGHDSWGAKMRIHETVEDVRHFIAGHEIRNSFPVDSISFFDKGRFVKPSHFHETIYPGVHSDVGGGYTPGEGGRALLPSQNFCLIPLNFMYKCAVRSGVPMLAEFKEANVEDFRIHPELVKSYNHYMKSIAGASSIGDLMNHHRRLYFAWRFRAIKKKLAGDTAEAEAIRHHNARFVQRKNAMSSEVKEARRKEIQEDLSLNNLLNTREKEDRGEIPLPLDELNRRVGGVSDRDIGLARQKYNAARWERIKVEAKQDTIPDMTRLQTFVDLYDNQLMADVAAIQKEMQPIGRRAEWLKHRRDLRPQYKALIEAWEDEFEHKRGLKDEEIIRFFDNYVHNSLAGFAKDATLPSDPRAVFVGGDTKLLYAKLDSDVSIMDSESDLA